MAAKPTSPFGLFLANALTETIFGRYRRKPPKRESDWSYYCLENHCAACSGKGCAHECHTLRAEDEADAEVFAYKAHPEGCQCGNAGGDCDWCRARQEWLINDPHWRLDAVQGLGEK